MLGPAEFSNTHQLFQSTTTATFDGVLPSKNASPNTSNSSPSSCNSRKTLVSSLPAWSIKAPWNFSHAPTVLRIWKN